MIISLVIRLTKPFSCLLASWNSFVNILFMPFAHLHTRTLGSLCPNSGFCCFFYNLELITMQSGLQTNFLFFFLIVVFRYKNLWLHEILTYLPTQYNYSVYQDDSFSGSPHGYINPNEFIKPPYYGQLIFGRYLHLF